MSAADRVVMTGLGAVTAHGPTLPITVASIRRSTVVLAPRELAVLPTRARPYLLAGANLPSDDGLPQRATPMLSDAGLSDHVDLRFTIAAAAEALQDAGLEYDESNNRVGSILTFEAPGMERVVATLFASMAAPPAGADDAMAVMVATLGEGFYRTQSFIYTHAFGKVFKLHGFATCINNACSSGIHALDLAAGMIRSGRADAMIVAGGEQFETGVRPAFFERHGFYATAPPVEPFGDEPTGFVVGEGAAAIVLEPEASAQRRGAHAYCRVHPAAFAQQSWHQTLPNVRDRRLAGVARDALTAAGVSPNDIDTVIPHGAATRVSDAYELDCLKLALGARSGLPPIYAFKGHVGHLLGASAVLDLALAAVMLGEGRAVGDPVPVSRRDNPAVHGIQTILKTATGFTGHDAAVVLTHRPRP